MTEREREVLTQLHQLHMELWDFQGDEIAGIRQALDALDRSHVTLGKILRTMAELLRDGNGRSH